MLQTAVQVYDKATARGTRKAPFCPFTFPCEVDEDSLVEVWRKGVAFEERKCCLEVFCAVPDSKTREAASPLPIRPDDGPGRGDGGAL